jgi:hypothetical protein
VAGAAGPGRGTGPYDPEQVAGYFAAATRAAQVLAAYRAPYRGRSSPVNAWWGSFDLAVSLYSGLPAEPPSDDFIMRNAGDAQQIEVGWWPGDGRYGRAAFFAYAHPAPPGFDRATCLAGAGMARWGSTSWTGTTSGRRRTRSAPRWSSPVRPSGTPAPCAGGTRLWRPAPKGPRRRSSRPGPRRTPPRPAARPPHAARP